MKSLRLLATLGLLCTAPAFAGMDTAGCSPRMLAGRWMFATDVGKQSFFPGGDITAIGTFWIDRQGTPHTEKLHMTERLTRTDYNTIKYVVTIDDPGAYTKPWTSGFNFRWTANSELFEYVCQDNNYAPELMVGAQEFVDRTSKIVP